MHRPLEDLHGEMRHRVGGQHGQSEMPLTIEECEHDADAQRRPGAPEVREPAAQANTSTGRAGWLSASVSGRPSYDVGMGRLYHQSSVAGTSRMDTGRVS